MQSMTGYGRGECRRDGKRLTLQLSSVNHRHCDIRFAMARQLAYLEQPLRDRLREKIDRGSLQVVIDLSTEGSAGTHVQANSDLAREYVDQLRQLSLELGLEDQLTLDSLLQMPDLFVVEKIEDAPETITAMAMEALDQALEGLLAMRQTEGQALLADLQQRREHTLELVRQVGSRAPLVQDDYRERLTQRLEQMLEDVEIDEERLVKEVAWFAEKADIAEEVTRLGSHLEQLGGLLTVTEPVGRKLDFLLQEMNREINTIGSKANDQELARLVVELKAELERMREQAQNVQ